MRGIRNSKETSWRQMSVMCLSDGSHWPATTAEYQKKEKKKQKVRMCVANVSEINYVFPPLTVHFFISCQRRSWTQFTCCWTRLAAVEQSRTQVQPTTRKSPRSTLITPARLSRLHFRLLCQFFGIWFFCVYALAHRNGFFLLVRPCVHSCVHLETLLTRYLAEYLTHFYQTYINDAYGTEINASLFGVKWSKVKVTLE